jgi:NitT/TauT family transport system substrate-binding protein
MASRFPRRLGLRTGTALAVAALTLSACGQSASQGGGSGDDSGGAPTITFATGGAQPPNEMEAAIFSPEMIDSGVLKNYGKKYKLKMISTKGTPEAQSLLVSGQANLATFSFSTIATTVTNDAVPGGISVVAGHFVDGAEGYHSNAYMVRDDSTIKSAKDLKGKTVGVNAVGTAVDIILRVWLKDNGVDPEKDVKFAEIPFPAMGAALKAGRIDLGAFVQPFTAIESAKGGVKPLFTARDSVGENSAITVVGRKDYLGKNSDAVKAFLADWVAGLQWLSDEANRTEAIAILAKASGAKPENLELFFGKPGDDYHRDPNACPNASALQAGVEGMVKTGYLPKSVKVADLVDTSYLPNPCTGS